jgi:hypothetical protein
VESNDEAKTAKEIIDQFFNNLTPLEGMDRDTANIIIYLWNQGKMNRDELLIELEKERSRKVNNDAQKA